MNENEGQIEPPIEPGGEELQSPPRRRRWLVLSLGGLAIAGAIASAAVAVVMLGGGGSDEPQAKADASAAGSGAAFGMTVMTPPPTPTAVPTPIPPPLENAAYHLVIDRIGVDAPVIPEGLDQNQDPIVPLNSYEVAWYTFSAQPGTGGNAVFAGHVTWGGEAVFYSLNQLAPGDVVRLKADDGKELVYTVAESFTVDPSDPTALSVMAPTTTDTVTIITCDGTRYYTGDPVFGHAYTERRVVRATLTSANVPAAVSAHSSGEQPGG